MEKDEIMDGYHFKASRKMRNDGQNDAFMYNEINTSAQQDERLIQEQLA